MGQSLKYSRELRSEMDQFKSLTDDMWQDLMAVQRKALAENPEALIEEVYRPKRQARWQDNRGRLRSGGRSRSNLRRQDSNRYGSVAAANPTRERYPQSNPPPPPPPPRERYSSNEPPRRGYSAPAPPSRYGPSQANPINRCPPGPPGPPGNPGSFYY